jgi:hypothetical protein
MPVYRKGLANATGREREWLRYAERGAINLASQAVYEAWCSDPNPGPGADRCPAFHSSALRWFRAERRLFVCVTVRFGRGDRSFCYRWRSPLRGASGGYAQSGVSVRRLTQDAAAATLRRRAGESGWVGASPS